MSDILRSACVLFCLTGYGGLTWCHGGDWPTVVFYGLLLLAAVLEAVELPKEKR